MKKTILLAVLGSLMVLSSSLSFAKDAPKPAVPAASSESQQSGPGTGMGGRNGMMGGMMNPMMMMSMMKPSITPTSDGGVVVQMGPTLKKYDKDLNLVKEVELMS